MKIKKLVWDKSNWEESYDILETKLLLGMCYQINPKQEKYSLSLRFEGTDSPYAFLGEFKILKKAKEAAQLHFEEFIMSWIEE